MSEQQPTGVTVYYDGEATNYPTATEFHVDPNSRALHVRRRHAPGVDANPGSAVVAVHAHGRWDSVEAHGPAPEEEHYLRAMKEEIGRLKDLVVALSSGMARGKAPATVNVLAPDGEVIGHFGARMAEASRRNDRVGQ